MNLLETLIKQILFEQRRTVAKIKNASAKMTAAARKVGAVHAYAILVKGTSNLNDILNLVEAATLASTSGDDNAVAVGKGSKFANGEYTYVCSQPDNDKRQLINIWIVPNSIINKLPNHEQPLNGATPDKRNGFARIGSSIMITKDVLSLFKDFNSFEVNNEWAELKSEIWTLTEPIEDQPDLDNKTYVDNVNTDNQNQSTDVKVADLNTTNPDDIQSTDYKFNGYPFKWQGQFDVYTMSDSDEWVYVKDNSNTWYTMKKTDFESNYTDVKKIQNLMTPLNKKGIINVTTKFGLPSQNNLEKLNTTTNVTDKLVNTDKTKIEKLNSLKTKKGTLFINIAKTPVYQYKNKQWKKIADYDPSDRQYIAYLGHSSDYKYIRVKFVKDQLTAWVPTSTVK